MFHFAVVSIVSNVYVCFFAQILMARYPLTPSVPINGISNNNVDADMFLAAFILPNEPIER